MKTTTYSSITAIVINLLMAERNITQKQLSDTLGLSISTASRLLRGKISISLSALKKISQLLGVNPADILTQSDEREKYLISKKWRVVDKTDDDYLLIAWESRVAFSRFIASSDPFELAVLVNL